MPPALRRTRFGSTVQTDRWPTRGTPCGPMLLEAADGVNVFVCEGYSPTRVRWHLDLDTLARHRNRLICRQLVLTRLSPSALTSDLTDWNVAHDGLRLDLG